MEVLDWVDVEVVADSEGDAVNCAAVELEPGSVEAGDGVALVGAAGEVFAAEWGTDAGRISAWSAGWSSKASGAGPWASRCSPIRSLANSTLMVCLP